MKVEGYWVPLETCARFIGDTLYIPLDAITREFGYIAEMNSDNSVITLK